MRHPTKIRTVFSAEEIASRVITLGQEIRAGAGAAEVFLLGILKGASFFTADLMRAISGPASYGFIDVVRDPADNQLALEIDFLSYIDIAGRNVYVLKDVVSTGIIEAYLLTQLRMHNPTSLQLVALLDRPNLRTIEIASDYRAFEVNEGTFVGYGLELEGRHANLPYIGRLT
jgi:hypoxanthine phosphoribosyltransferase